MTRDERKAIRERCEAATEEPWRVGVDDSPIKEIADAFLVSMKKALPFGGVDGDVHVVITEELNICITGNGPARKQNSHFIASARQDIPALLEENDTLREVVRELEYLDTEHDKSGKKWCCCGWCGGIAPNHYERVKEKDRPKTWTKGHTDTCCIAALDLGEE